MSYPLATMLSMDGGRIWVEAWSPEYGASFEVENGLAPSDEEVAPYVELEDWEAVTPAPSSWPAAAFVDGVSRVDARAFLDAGPLTIPGICGSVGIGSVLVNGPLQKATYGPSEIHRAVIFGSGAAGEMPPVSPSIVYESRSVPGARQEEIRKGLESYRGQVEAELAKSLARLGLLVIADGPLGIFEPQDIVAFIKSHHRAYLPPDLEPFVRGLGAGQRTPVFQFGVIRPRYSWYLRLAESAGQHPWAAIARCEVSATMPLEHAVELANLVTHHLPEFASKPFWDSRAPQNLVPIGTLERRLRHLLGDPELIYRKIRSALMRGNAEQAA